jgi:hypothetical protein
MMSEIGDRLRDLFEEIAPRPDVKGILGSRDPAPRSHRSWAVATAGAVSIVGVTLALLLTGGPDRERSPEVVTTDPGTTLVGTIPSTTTATTVADGDPIAALVPQAVECQLHDTAIIVFPCPEVTDFDDSTSTITPWSGGLPVITLTFADEVTVHGIRLQNLTDQSGFLRRARIQRVEIVSESGATAILGFVDEHEEQVLPLEPATVSGREITIRVVALYPPQSFDDQPAISEFALAELTLLGRVAGGVDTITSWAGEWSYVTLDPSRQGIALALAFNGESFALITRMEGGDTLVWESIDGLQWREIVDFGANDIAGGPRDITDSAVLDGWVAVGVRDGRATAWRPKAGAWQEVPIDLDTDSPGSAALSVVERAGRLVAAGYYAPANSGFPPEVMPAIWVSDDGGASWQAAEVSGATRWRIHSVVAGPAGLLGLASSTMDSVVGSQLLVFRSIDGLVWEQITPIGLAARQIDAAFADGDGYIALDGPSGQMWESVDGTNWAASALPGRPREGNALAHFGALTRFYGSIVVVGDESYDQPNGFNTAAPIAASQIVGGWAVTSRTQPGSAYFVAGGMDRLVMAGELIDTPEGSSGRVTIFVFQPDHQPEPLPCTDRTPPLPEQDLPPAVAETRRAIHAAAVSCDWDELARLTGGGDFFYNYEGLGGVGSPIQYWVDLMSEGEDILGQIATVLTLPARRVSFGDGRDEWVWPAIAYKDEPSDADWQALLPLYDQERIDHIRSGGEGYAGGFFLQIGLNGHWTAAGTMLV